MSSKSSLQPSDFEKKEWKPNIIDLIISTTIAVLFPFLAQFLNTKTGALLPMIIYYGLAWGLAKWRRGSTGYFNPIKKKLPRYFIINVIIIILSLVCAYLAPLKVSNPDILGVILTGLIWATINASSEQLVWIYIFESWDLYLPKAKDNNLKKWLYRVIGLILFSTFVGMIHTMYWVNFLHTVDSSQTIGVIFVLLTTISGFLHIAVWRESNQMIFTFIPHFLLNLFPLFWTGYSILPFLIN